MIVIKATTGVMKQGNVKMPDPPIRVYKCFTCGKERVE